MTNTALILGAGRGQVPIMNLCHKYGWRVCAVSPEGNYPGLAVADKVCYANVRDEEAVLEIAKAEHAKVLLTDQLDAAVLTGAIVSEKLGLPGIGAKVATAFTNKYVMRKCAAELGINVPACVTVTTFAEVEQALSDLSFPLIMKPVDSAASRGVFKVNSIDEIAEHFDYTKSCSKTDTVIIEQFIEGSEYVVEAFTRNFDTTNLVVGHRDYFQISDTFIPSATVFTDAMSATSDLEKRLLATNKQLVEGYGLPFGITHGEYIYNEKEDKIYLVEIAARGGGVFISSHLIPGACGVNANDLLVREALGLPQEGIAIQPGASAYFCYLTPSGTVTELSGLEEVEAMEDVIEAFFDNIYLGMECKSITDKSSRKGPILVSGKTKQDCYDVIEEAKKRLVIKVTNKGQLQDVIW